MSVRPKRFRTNVFRACIALALFSSARIASANEAATLFDEGVRLLDEKRYPEACAKLERSQELEASAGTILNLAGCYELLGKKSEALVAFRRAKEAALFRHRDDWQRLAEEHIVKLEEELAREEKKTPPPKNETLVEPPPTIKKQATDHDGSTLRPLSIALMGAGGGGLVLGTVGALLASSALDEAKGNCRSYPDRCSEAANAPNDHAKTWSTVSTISFIAGGAVLATGAVLFFVQPSKKTELGFSPTPSGAHASLRIRF